MDFDSVGFKYQNIATQNSDILRLQKSYNKRNDPWYFINAMPSILTIFRKHHGGKANFLVNLQPNQILSFSPDMFQERDKLYTYYYKNKKLIPFMEPYTIVLQSKTIKFGAVTYTSEAGRGGSQAGYFDIEGIWLNNRLPIPLDVYFRGNLVVQLYGYSGIDYMGGGASEVYFDNGRQGINYLDTFEFKYSLPGKEGLTLFTVTIDDVQCQKMFIGTVSSSDESPFPDNSVYRIQEPNYTAVTYFVPVGDGKSLMTNPNSPFYS